MGQWSDGLRGGMAGGKEPPMREVDVPLPETVAVDVAGAVTNAARAAGLVETRRGTLAGHPGCVHWHFQRPGERGTLEVTWRPNGPRLWIKIASGRAAAWQEAAVPELARTLEAALVGEGPA